MVLNLEQRQSIIGGVDAAVARLYANDPELINRRGMERSIAFRFGLYFNDAIRDIPWINALGLTLDLEYNKNGLHPKRTTRRPLGVQPDLILHRREQNEHNLLVIEFKGWWNNYSREIDRIKLEDFVHQEGEYRYGIGILIEINTIQSEREYFYGY